MWRVQRGMPIAPKIDGKALKERTTFRMEVGVATVINAPVSRVWDLLTNAADIPRWNSTVESVKGSIAHGETIRLRVKVAPNRVFKLKVTEFEPQRRMVWSDGFAPMFRGERTYKLDERDGKTTFSMIEVFSGLMLPMIAGSLPDFGPPFEEMTRDLKRAAEEN